MTTVRLDGEPTDAPAPRRLVLDRARWTALRATAPGIDLPAPFHAVPDPDDVTDDERDRATADLITVGVLQADDAGRHRLHPSVAASLLLHAGPEVALRVDARRFREVEVLRGAVAGPLCSTLTWSAETASGRVTEPLQGVTSDPVMLTTSSVRDLVGQLVSLLGPAPARPHLDVVEVDAAATSGLLGNARVSEEPAVLPPPLDAWDGELPGTFTLHLDAAGRRGASLRWVSDGEGWWDVSRVPDDAQGRARLRLTPVDGARLHAILTSALARRLGGGVRG